MPRSHHVVVGVDGSERARSAVRYGAQEARAADLDLTLVHVAPDHLPMSPMMPLLPTGLTQLGPRLLAEARETSIESEPSVRVSTRLLHGGAATQLVASSADARMVVLGREAVPAWARVFTGAVTTGVAARAECPVVAVPAGWTRDDARSRSVVVGVEATDHEDRLLEHALTRAAGLGAALTALHAWELSGPYDDIIVHRTHAAEWNREAQQRIEQVLSRLRPAHPHVEVDVQVLHRQPALALREASQAAGLLVLGRHGQHPSLRHLGGTARALLREADCPIEIVPEVTVGAAPEPAGLKDAGEATP